LAVSEGKMTSGMTKEQFDKSVEDSLEIYGGSRRVLHRAVFHIQTIMRLERRPTLTTEGYADYYPQSREPGREVFNRNKAKKWAVYNAAVAELAGDDDTRERARRDLYNVYLRELNDWVLPEEEEGGSSSSSSAAYH
jgi:hypothetical protein